MKVVFIISSVTDSHIIKRVDSFVEAGHDVEVYGFARGVNTVNRFNKVDLKVLGQVEDQKYIGRLKSEWRAVNNVITSHPKDTLYYVWGYEFALICYIRNCRFLYEISDMRYPQMSFPFKQLLGWLDKKIINKSVGTLITSEGFIQYMGMSSSDRKFILMPNKLAEVMLSEKRPDAIKIKDKIRFGFVGYYRYPDTVIRLARVIAECYPNMEFHFWGTGPEQILSIVKKLVANHENIIEHGTFKNPDDLNRIYDTIDIVACNYDSMGANERIAEPNKLYESIFYNRPILVSTNTFLGKKVERMGVGYVLESHSDDNIKQFLNTLNVSDIEKKSVIERNIPTKDLVEDYSQVWERMNNL